MESKLQSLNLSLKKLWVEVGVRRLWVWKAWDSLRERALLDTAGQCWTLLGKGEREALHSWVSVFGQRLAPDQKCRGQWRPWEFKKKKKDWSQRQTSVFCGRGLRLGGWWAAKKERTTLLQKKVIQCYGEWTKTMFKMKYFNAFELSCSVGEAEKTLSIAHGPTNDQDKERDKEYIRM